MFSKVSLLVIASSLQQAVSFGFGIGKPTAAPKPTTTATFEGMPGAFGWAESKGLAESLLVSWPDGAKYIREAEIKHARLAMLAAVGFPLQELWHPLFGGAINEPSYLAFQASPLENFWPIVVGAIGIVESASAVAKFKNPQDGWWQLKDDYEGGGALGFDPLGFSDNGDLRSEELQVGRVAMIAIATMVLQELYTQSGLFANLN
eukprot:CAMPEP_0118907546 /NCGR_PEP_ID=MMETSP1166-20130328/10951_1 /TAXON_ID=1104430 /ORGANISM="Chrysoreinhardia sp, Strain CCMP3193" /LENGTH=204 /DNA_ID=CAMNT_0006846917 /DNA_START=1 /DNA_END=615 /DNA_ORIENTATION=-